MFEYWEYWLAWGCYVLAGVGCCIVWWRITRGIRNSASRDLLRGMVAVLIFTPWFAGDNTDFYAPALAVLMFDLLLENARNGLISGIALLVSLFLVLIVLATRQLLRSRAARR